jgi:hypothetical protein
MFRLPYVLVRAVKAEKTTKTCCHSKNVNANHSYLLTMPEITLEVSDCDLLTTVTAKSSLLLTAMKIAKHTLESLAVDITTERVE